MQAFERADDVHGVEAHAEPRKIVISQSMYFPWVGLLEQIRLADVFVHYDDVQYARGFFNRVQVKTPNGVTWMTVPLKGHHRGQFIDEVLIDDQAGWKAGHRRLLEHSYRKAPFLDDMLRLVDEVFAEEARTLADLSRHSILCLADYFGVTAPRFVSSRSLDIPGASSRRLLDIVSRLGGNIYITGHGARNYLDHALFEDQGIAVEYMRYERRPYAQLHGDFTPYVTALDLVANCGREGIRYISSGTVDWKEFVQ